MRVPKDSIYMAPLALSRGITQKLRLTLSLEVDTKSWNVMMHDQLFSFSLFIYLDERNGYRFYGRKPLAQNQI